VTADDDDARDEADPVLRSMRSVWVSMRDEDPPAGGLTELLAAARAKADEMKPAPWWQRMFAVLVRPPMLAAATVVVLIGGGIVISQRSKDLIEQPTASSAQTASAPKGSSELTGDAAAPATDTDESRTLTPEGEGQAAAAATGDTQSSPPPPSRRRRPVKETRSEPPVMPAPAPTPEPPPPPPAPPKVDTIEGGITTGRAPAGGEKLEIATEDSLEDDAKKPAPENATIKQTAPSPEQRRSGQPPVDQLVKQAEVAASRKDCGAVRVTVNRIKKLDETVYRQRVIKQPAIASCLK
jgi:hypothetical protein